MDRALQANTELKRQMDGLLAGAVQDSNAELLAEKRRVADLEQRYAALLLDYKWSLALNKKQQVVVTRLETGLGRGVQGELPKMTKSTSAVRLGRNLM